LEIPPTTEFQDLLRNSRELFDFGGDKKKAKDENIGEGTAKRAVH